MAAEVLDEELEEGLRQAKKKPRNFVVVVKGAKAVKLLVSKKPIKSGEIQAAKSEAKGTGFYKGVCQGDGGTEMPFKLIGELPSIKEIQFKEFIAEQTGLTIKPRFEVVTELAEIDDEAEAATKTQPPPTGGQSAAPNPLEQQVRQGLEKVTPHYDQALASAAVAAPLKAQLGDLRKKLDAAIQSADWKNAVAILSQLVVAVKSASPASAATPVSAANSVTQDWQKAKEAWEEAAQEAGEQVNELAAVLGELDAEDLPPLLVEDLKAIAKFGLPALTKNLRTPMIAAILDVERAPADKRPALASAGGARVDQFLKHLASDPAIAAVDQNPFGVNVTMRATLEPPLNLLRRVFQRQATGK